MERIFGDRGSSNYRGSVTHIIPFLSSYDTYDPILRFVLMAVSACLHHLCHPSAQPGASCFGGLACGGGSFCNGAVCTCSPGQIISGGVCTVPNSGISVQIRGHFRKTRTVFQLHLGLPAYQVPFVLVVLFAWLVSAPALQVRLQSVVCANLPNQIQAGPVPMVKSAPGVPIVRMATARALLAAWRKMEIV